MGLATTEKEEGVVDIQSAVQFHAESDFYT